MKKLLVLIVLVIGLTTTLQAQYAQKVRARLADSILDGDLLDPCTDTLILYRPNAALSNITYTFPGSGGTVSNVDSVVLTKKNNGRLSFSSSQIVMYVDIHLASSIPKAGVMRDSSFCEAGFKPFVLYAGDLSCRSYQWYGGVVSNNNSISINHFDTFIVKQTNGCGPNWDTAVVFKHNSHPKLSLGPDVTTCDGNQIILSPNHTDYVSYDWVKTGKSGVRDTVTTTNRYKLRTVDVIGCKDSAEKQVTMVKPYAGLEICKITVNETLQRNQIFWEPLPANANADSVLVYLEIATGQYKLIARADKDSLSVIDTSSRPQFKAYKYVIRVKDSCLNLGPMSSPHQTVCLIVSNYNGTSVGFSWSGYIGYTPGVYYVIGIDTSGADLLDSVVGTQTFYNWSQPGAYDYYYIGFPKFCQHFLLAPAMNVPDLVKSNPILKKSFMGIIHQNGVPDVNIFPNPTTGLINIQCPVEVSVRLTDMTGKTLITDSKNQNINITSYPSGTYFLQLQAPNGVTVTKKIMKQ